MEDELEKYVTENTTQFNTFTLDEVDKLKMWSKIDSQITAETKVIPLWKTTRFRAVASVIILIACTFSFFKIMNTNSNDGIVNQELYHIDNHYKALVSNQVQLIKSNINLSEEEKTEFLMLESDLNTEYKKLKIELEEGINNQKIIDAIINNYKKKIQLMEDLLERSYPSKNNFDSSEIIL